MKVVPEIRIVREDRMPYQGSSKRPAGQQKAAKDFKWEYRKDIEADAL